MLEVKYSNQASKFLKKIYKELANRIFDEIEALQQNPFPQNMKRVEGKKLFRVRVGDYRILYEIDNQNNLLGIVKIDKRERVYD
ncbi:MAG: type II toxin-antitoxin system RelE/ParE family toxin [Nanoarchaeota archaeon]